MALRVRDCIDSARFEHPAFTPQVCPSSIAARMANKVQRKLLLATHQRNASYLVRTWVIALLPGQNLATIGAGSTQGAPLVQGTTDFEVTDSPAGALAEVDPAATVQVAARAATGGSTGTLADTTQAWTVNAYLGMLVTILEGTGKGQTAEIGSNTATQLNLSLPWELAPDATSIYQVMEQEYVATGALATQLGDVPATTQRQGWLVRLDAAGQPYLDLAAPVSVPMTQGIPLPPNHHVLHGSYYSFSQDQNIERYPSPFTLVAPIDRHQPARTYAGYVQGEQLYLCAPMTQWQNVQRIEIPYLPLAPAIRSADDVLMLPEAAEEAVVAGIALLMGERAQILGQAGIDLADFKARQRELEGLYLLHVAGAGRALAGRIKDVW